MRRDKPRTNPMRLLGCAGWPCAVKVGHSSRRTPSLRTCAPAGGRPGGRGGSLVSSASGASRFRCIAWGHYSACDICLAEIWPIFNTYILCALATFSPHTRRACRRKR